MAELPGSLSTSGRFPLDGKYWVNTKAELPNGLISDGLFRWTKDTHQLYINVGGVWKHIDTFTSLLTNEVSSNSQGIVGLTLQDTIKWLANNRCCGDVDPDPTPTPTLSSITINGPTSINEGASGTFTITATYSDNTSQPVTTGITWGSNSPNGVVTIPSNSTQGDSTTIIVSASYSGQSATKTVAVVDTTVPPTPTYQATTQSYTTTSQDYITKCGAGTSGTAVTKTSSTGTSTISQADANSKALLDAKNQAIAAIVCPVQTTYTSTKSYTANCDTTTSHYGSSVTKSSTKTSTVSQADADQLALADATSQANAVLVCYTFNQTYNPGDNISTINWNATPNTLLLVNLPLSTNTDPNPATMTVVLPDGVTQVGAGDYNGADTGATIGIKYQGVVYIKTLTNGTVTLN